MNRLLEIGVPLLAALSLIARDRTVKGSGHVIEQQRQIGSSEARAHSD